MNLIPASIKTLWTVVDAKLRPYWWAFALALLVTL